MTRREVEGQLGEVAERRRDPLERPQRGDIGERDRQRGAALGDPEVSH